MRISRGIIDDSISTNLNALSTPSLTSPFDPKSTSIRIPSSTRYIPSSSCARFLNDVLFPTWQGREDVIHYCASVAERPDPEDPDAVSREDYNRKGEERRVDERLDPYSGRFFPKEPRTEELGRFIKLEAEVEEIVRERSWESVVRRCEGLGFDGRGREWEREFRKWQKKHGRGQEGKP
jgi:hypothetical protein